ncbi:hypothetical protein [Cribrihabitans marinus]|nr:hypothetical protein [Cribrihabitans marinus]
MNKLKGAVAAAALAVALPAAAQERTGWAAQVDGLSVWQDDADLDGGGAFSASRTFLRAGGLYRTPGGTSAGLFLSYGQLSYDFSAAGNRPWEDIRDIRLSAPLRLQLGETGRLFVAPQIRWDYERGASASDGRTYGVFAGVTWQLGDRLRIGPAFGAFSGLGSDGDTVFPALLVDWQIADGWTLSTGSGLGATQGPGLTLSYDYSDTVRLSLSARREEVRFRLDDAGLAPGGVGEDSSIPVVLALDYAPNPGLSLSLFAGAEINGRLKLEDAAGRRVDTQDYETAPIAGLAFRARF